MGLFFVCLFVGLGVFWLGFFWGFSSSSFFFFFGGGGKCFKEMNCSTFSNEMTAVER